jgi:tetratricopeptide (TPR) repeat protein
VPLLARALDQRPRDTAALYYMGFAEFQLRKFDDARRSLERALMFDPSMTAAKLMLARLELAAGYTQYRESRSAEAQERLRKALELDPGLDVARVLLADTYFDLGRQDLSRSEILAFLESVPDDRPQERAAGCFLLGMVARNEAAEEKDPEKRKALLDDAARAFVTVVQLDEANWRGHFQLGLTYEMMGAMEQALENLDRARIRAPGLSLMSYEMTRILYREGRASEAIKLLEVETAENPDVADYPHILGDLLRRIGDTEGALRAYREARRRDPDDVGAVLTPARMAVRRGRADDGRDLVRSCVDRTTKDESRAALDRWLGELAFQEGRYEDAANRLEQAIQAGESDPAAAVRLGQSLEKLGQPARAVGAYRVAMERGLDDLAVLRQLGDLLHLTGDASQAITVYEKILERTPDDLAVANNLALALADERIDLDRALSLAERVRAALPDEPAVADTLGWVLLQREEPERALRLLTEAFRRLPASPAIRFHLALAWMETGREEKGRAELRSLSIDEGVPDALKKRIQRALR